MNFYICKTFLLCYTEYMKTKISKKQTTNVTFSPLSAYILLFAFLLRIILAAVCKGFESDIVCFGSWALRVYEGGFGSFYSPDVFTDYPPGYIYILYPIGALLHHLKLNMLSPMGLILLKMPSILSDLAAAWLIYRISSRRFHAYTALLLSALYTFNPAVLTNSVIWGQVDSILVFFVLLLCLALMERRVIPACFIFAAGILFKPQMLIFTPLLLYGIYEVDILGFQSMRRFFLDVLGGIAAIFALLLGMLPFGLDKVIPQYTDTLGSYPYVSVNAYNFWAMFKLNWNSQSDLLFGISYKTWGTVILVLLTVISAVIFELSRRNNQEHRYFITGAFLMITTFMFSVRMHERYLYPAMLLLLFAYIYSGHKALLYSYILLSAAHFLNVWHVLYYYDPGTYYSYEHVVVMLSAVTVFAAGYFYHALILLLNGKKAPVMTSTRSGTLKPQNATELINPAKLKAFLERKPVSSRKALRFTGLDLGIILTLCLAYGIVAFLNLGYAKAPVTEYTWPAGSSITLQFDKESLPKTLSYYLKYEVKISYDFKESKDGSIWHNTQALTMEDVFSWGQVELSEGTAFIELTNTSEDAALAELIFLNANGDVVSPLNASEYPTLFDEPETLPETFDFRSSAYFDEIYYHRTAYEFIEGLPAYENTHPQLGKIFMVLGALIFGTNPFGFRFMGALFGVLMLPFMYLLARNLTGNKAIGAMAAVIFAFDFMHFTQTRLATIDVFIVFFIIVMYYFMERYLSKSFYDTSLIRTLLPLGACGISFGLGISSKWTGFYAGAGLAILFFASLFNRYREYRYACARPNSATNGISHKHIMECFIPNTIKTIAFCMIFFVLVPACIYTLCYIPFKDYSSDNFILRMWHNQFSMYNYHSKLEATHAYASSWYDWPTMERPVFYFSNKLGNDIYQGISAFGNPFVWYPAIPAAIYTFYLAIRKKKTVAAFLSVGLLAQFTPWLLVTRCTFLYHYFPSVPFLVLMIAYAAAQLRKRLKPRTFYILCGLYTLAVVVLFALFYPVISGMPVSGQYVDAFLRWKDGWVLILN